ncbi:MAG: cryptochrome/photolyase family protein, partial [Planctomycetota bacterium]
MADAHVWDAFAARMHELSDLGGVMGLLGWDEQVMCPPGGREARAQHGATLAAIHHQRLVDPAYGEAIEAATALGLGEAERAMLREARRQRDRATKLPEAFVRRLAEQRSRTNQAWEQARETGAFADYRPALEELVRLKVEEADLLKGDGTRYDALLDDFEPGMRLERLAPLLADRRLSWGRNPFYLTDHAIFESACGRGAKARFRMDTFYRKVRAATGLLMDGDGSPEGGRISFDAENRQPWKGDPRAPIPPRFPMSDLRREVAREIESRFSTHPGTLDIEALPATQEDAVRLWSWAKSECLEHFGPYEDAMSRRSRGLFHTRISPVLNLGRILPHRLVDDVAAMTDLPLPSREGFIRQVIGWREFVR